MTSDDFNDFAVQETALLETEAIDEQRDRAEEAYNQTLIENPNMENPHADGPLSALSPEQRVRVAALNMAKPLLSAKGLLGSTGAPPDLAELIRLASWILDGNEEPLYPYVNGGVIVLGPDLYVSVDGDSLTWKSTTYLKEESNED